MSMIKADEKKLTIHMVNGDEYHLYNNAKALNKDNYYNISEIYEVIRNGILDNKRLITLIGSGIDIVYMSRFSIIKCDKVSIQASNISSFELVEENQNVKCRKV